VYRHVFLRKAAIRGINVRHEEDTRSYHLFNSNVHSHLSLKSLCEPVTLLLRRKLDCITIESLLHRAVKSRVYMFNKNCIDRKDMRSSGVCANFQKCLSKNFIDLGREIPLTRKMCS